jgi:hypothetical protein
VRVISRITRVRLVPPGAEGFIEWIFGAAELLASSSAVSAASTFGRIDREM